MLSPEQRCARTHTLNERTANDSEWRDIGSNTSLCVFNIYEFDAATTYAMGNGLHPCTIQICMRLQRSLDNA